MNCSLKSLEVWGGVSSLELAPAFSHDVHQYRATMDYEAFPIWVDAVTHEKGCLVRRSDNIEAIGAGKQGKVAVTTADAERKDFLQYSVAVTRRNGREVDLKSLAVSGVKMLPAFASDTTDYVLKARPAKLGDVVLHAFPRDMGQQLEVVLEGALPPTTTTPATSSTTSPATSSTASVRSARSLAASGERPERHRIREIPAKLELLKYRCRNFTLGRLVADGTKLELADGHEVLLPAHTMVHVSAAAAATAASGLRTIQRTYNLVIQPLPGSHHDHPHGAVPGPDLEHDGDDPDVAPALKVLFGLIGAGLLILVLVCVVVRSESLGDGRSVNVLESSMQAVSTAASAVTTGRRAPATFDPHSYRERERLGQVQVLLAKEREFGPDHPEVAAAVKDLANVHADLGNPRRELELLQRAFAIEEREFGPRDSRVTATRARLGNAHGKLGNPMKQMELLEETLRILEEEHGSDHPEVAVILTNLGNAHGSIGEAERQRSLLERALGIKEKHLGPEHASVSITLTGLGEAYGSLGETDKQMETLRRALRIKEREFGPHDPETAVTLSNLGVALRRMGQAEQAMELLERALAINEQTYGPDKTQVAMTLANLAQAVGDLGDTGRQIDMLQRALLVFERELGPDNLHTSLAREALNRAMPVEPA